MKPIFITMQGFGPYIQPTTIDFSALGKSPVFLITGATGGGKTTILDAMCFALYCKSTGGRRSWSGMRSTAADDTLTTSVDFSFELGDACYRFCRSQAVHFVRGSGRREIRDEHACYQLTAGNPADDTAQWKLLVAGSESKVRDYAERLLGLTCEQFSQVIVLPQGDFLKLLRANSNGKAEILQTLFKTQIWSRITEKMKQHTQELFRSVEQLYTEKNTLLQQEAVDTVEALSEKCEQAAAVLHVTKTEFNHLQQNLQKMQEELHTAKTLLQKFTQKQHLEQTQQQLLSLNPQILEKQRRLDTAKQIEQIFPYWQNYHNAIQTVTYRQNALSTAEQSYKQALAHLEMLGHEQNSIAQKKKEILRLEQTLPDLERNMQAVRRLETLCTQQKELENITEQKQQQQTQIQAQINALELRIQNDTKHLQELEKQNRLLPEYNEQFRILTEYNRQFQTRAQLQTEQQAAQQALNIAQNKIQQQKQILAQTQQQLTDLQTTIMQNSALTIAQTLQENAPCPVCGSLHHPTPATSHTTQQTDTLQLTELTQHLELLQVQYQQELQAFTRAQTILDEKNKQLTDCIALCEQIPLTQTDLPLKLQQQTELIEKTKSMVATQNKSEIGLQKLQHEQSCLKEAMEKNKREMADYQQQIASVNASVKEIQSGLSQPQNINDLQAVWKNFHNMLAQYKKETAQWDEQWLQATTKSASQEVSLKHAKKDLLEAQEFQQKTLTALLEKQQACAWSLSADADLNAMHISHQEMLDLERDITDHTTQKKAIAEQLRLLNEQLKDQTMPNLPPLEAKYAQLQAQQQTLSLKIGSQTQLLQTSQTTLIELTKLSENARDTQTQYEQANRLYLLLSGSNEKKIPLHLFILSVMLDDILTYANEFFSRLSRGRYSLRRLEGSTEGNAKRGLDLEVLDGFTGAPRSIETLSGGEQFLASLSLAFGLSDVVQSYSGSIRLDSIFIDEGFGSLDRETLDTAMKALSQIHKMGRTVGIISHVSELKSLIPTQIQVQPSKNGGSTITIVKDL